MNKKKTKRNVGAAGEGQRHCKFFMWTWQRNGAEPRPFFVERLLALEECPKKYVVNLFDHLLAKHS